MVPAHHRKSRKYGTSTPIRVEPGREKSRRVVKISFARTVQRPRSRPAGLLSSSDAGVLGRLLSTSSPPRPSRPTGDRRSREYEERDSTADRSSPTLSSALPWSSAAPSPSEIRNKNVLKSPMVHHPPAPHRIVNEIRNKSVHITRWTLRIIQSGCSAAPRSPRPSTSQRVLRRRPAWLGDVIPADAAGQDFFAAYSIGQNRSGGVRHIRPGRRVTEVRRCPDEQTLAIWADDAFLQDQFRCLYFRTTIAGRPLLSPHGTTNANR